MWTCVSKALLNVWILNSLSLMSICLSYWNLTWFLCCCQEILLIIWRTYSSLGVGSFDNVIDVLLVYHFSMLFGRMLCLCSSCFMYCDICKVFVARSDLFVLGNSCCPRCLESCWGSLWSCCVSVDDRLGLIGCVSN